MQKPYPNVLVVSHNVFSASGNMGKTMAELLRAFPPECLAQLYFQDEVPTLDLCRRYYRGRATSRTDTGLLARAHQLGRRRTPLIYFARNALWRVGRWDSPALREWIRAFSPDVILFAAGDYAFAYRVVCTIAARERVPVVTWCCDDFYLRASAGTPLGAWDHKNLMRWVQKTMTHTARVVTISDEMAHDYAALLRKPTVTLRIPADENPYRLSPDARRGILYAGGLGVNRAAPLMELGRALKAARIPGLEWIDVYSGERNEKTLARLTPENGIRFHGAVPAAQIPKLLGAARYVVHVEARDRKSMARTSYSLSTKIGESLRSGACIVAYGPARLSSMAYLRAAGAACFHEDAGALAERLRRLGREPEAYLRCVENAARLAREKHDRTASDETILRVLQSAAETE